MVSRAEAERRGLIGENGEMLRYEPPNFAAFHPDAGFHSNRSAKMYQGSTKTFSLRDGLAWDFEDRFHSTVNI